MISVPEQRAYLDLQQVANELFNQLMPLLMYGIRELRSHVAAFTTSEGGMHSSNMPSIITTATTRQ